MPKNDNPAPKILIVEDDMILQKGLEDKVKSAGFQTIVADDGPDAVKKALAGKPDLIVLDIILPRFSGVEVMKKLRENDWGRKVPVILLTNIDSSDDTLNEVVKYNPSHYILKSAGTFNDVVIKIREKLGMSDN